MGGRIMKVVERHPVDFTPDLHIAKLYQGNVMYQYNLDIDIVDVLIIYYLKMLKIYFTPQENDIFFLADDEQGHIYFSVNYEEFISMCPLAKISKEDFYSRIDRLEKLNLIVSIEDMERAYYKCTGLTDDIMEIF